LEIRPCTDKADKELVLAIYNEALPANAVSLAEVSRWQAGQTAVADFLGFLDDAAAGSVAVGIGHARPDTAHAFLAVLPSLRRRGVGSALYGEVSAWAADQGAANLAAWIEADDSASVGFAERRGFVVTARESRFTLELGTHEPEPVDPPEGIEIVRWSERPELARGLHEVSLETHAEIPGSEDWAGEPFAAWERMHRPDRMFAAVAGDDVVGFAELYTTDARPTVASHMMTAVRRRWRRRGIAGALKRAQIAWAKENGYAQIHAENEFRNEPIRRLNRSLGYREGPGRIKVRGPLAS
jgi:GNAT superfamily N-acetyltransferase